MATKKTAASPRRPSQKCPAGEHPGEQSRDDGACVFDQIARASLEAIGCPNPEHHGPFGSLAASCNAAAAAGGCPALVCQSREDARASLNSFAAALRAAQGAFITRRADQLLEGVIASAAGISRSASTLKAKYSRPAASQDALALTELINELPLGRAGVRCDAAFVGVQMHPASPSHRIARTPERFLWTCDRRGNCSRSRVGASSCTSADAN